MPTSQRVPLMCLAALALVGCGTSTSDVPGYAGNQLFAANCSSCHGTYAEGDGPVSAVLRVPIPDLRYLAARNGGDFPRELVARIIDGRELRAAHGDRTMPVWGEELLLTEGFDSAAEQRVAAKVAALTQYLESIQVQE